MALALCLTLLPTAALAADGAQAADGMTHTPSHSGKELKMDNTLMKDGVVWNPTAVSTYGSDTETSYVLDDGVYYLGSNLTIDHVIMINGNVKLCLNGFSITCTNPSADYVIAVYANTNSELTLTDCKPTGKIEGGKSAGVELRRGYTLNMHGGTITGGVDMSGNTKGSPTKFNMYGGTITGGGVGVKLTESCEFTMSGGTISNNKGGVLTGGGVFTMSGGEISGNTATSNGGGVNIGNGGKFEMSGTAKITGNTAAYAGGGVYVSGGTFIMNGGEIKSNIAKTNGGGVYVTKVASSSNSAFTMNGGEIKSNTANTAGGGVFVDNGTFTVSGEPIVSENTSGSEGNKVTDNVYLPASKTITIGSGLTNGTDIGVTTGSAMAPTEDSTIAITTPTENAHGYLSYFKSDNDSYEIKANSEQTQLVLKARPKIDLTNSAEITITSKSADLVYTGNPITVKYEVKCGNTVLTKGKDYTVSGDSGTDATDYTLKITGTGQYTGSVEKEWKITPLTVNVDLQSVKLNGKVYDGTTAGSSDDVASVEFKDLSSQSVTLTKGTDYTIKSVTYTDANVTAKEQNVEVEVTLQNRNYTFGNTQTTQVGTQGKIAKASAPKETISYNLNVVNNKKHTYELDLNTLLPTLSGVCDYGTKKYTLVRGELDLTGSPYYDGGTGISTKGMLTLPIASANDKRVGETISTGQVKVTTQNYKDITLTINVIASDAEKTNPNYTAPTAKTPTYNGQAQALINPGTVTGGTMWYKVNDGEYSTDIPKATNAGEYTVYYMVKGSDGYNDLKDESTMYVTATISPASAAVTITGASATKTYGDADFTLTASVKNPGTNGTWTWTSSAPDVLKVVGDGNKATVTVLKASDTAVEITAEYTSDNTTAEKATVSIKVNKATPTGEPIYTKITAANKTLEDANLKPNTSWPTGTVKWVGADGKELPETTEVKANTAYKWIFTLSAENAANYTTATGELTLYSVSTGGSSDGGGGGSSSSVTTVKTNTVTNPDGSVTKIETKSDGTVVATTTAKDGSVTKTTTKKDGSSVTESKNANGSTGTVKTDKNGRTEASVKISDKAVSDAKNSGEPVKAPVEVEASRNSNTAPTVKVELPKNAGETEVEIPVSNAKPGTVAVLVHPDGTEEILKASVPTENGIRLTMDGSATVKIIDNSKDFVDTRNHWAREEIDFVSARELVNGMTATIYAPNASATRAQLWTILARQNDANLSGGNTWYEKAQLWSKDKGISDGTNPNGTINRAQMVTMLWRTMGQPAATGKVGFADVPANSYYAQAVAWAVENGITTGVGGGKFDPNSACTRAQIAAFLARSMK